MSRLFAVSFVVFLFISIAARVIGINGMIHAEGRCIWYGQCKEIEPGKWLNCYNNTRSVHVEDYSETYNALESVCPWYIGKQPNSTYVCCDLNQINTLKSDSVKMMKQLLGGCPSCFQNFMNVFCAITCDPSNSLFMDVIDLYHKNHLAIHVVGVYFTDYYANKFFNSCKNVHDPQGSSKVICLTCGVNDPCTGQNWLEFMGGLNIIAPGSFSMYFSFSSDPSGIDLPTNMSARNATLLDCNDLVDGVTCSCSDCPAVCPAALEEDSIQVSTGILVGLIGILIYSIIFVIIVKVLVYTKMSNSKTSSQKPFFLKNADQKFEGLINHMFTRWGYFAADYWYLVLPVALIVVVACCIGLAFCETTADPVELWSVPNGRAQEEKEYFDQHFGPLYRMSRIIITAPNSPAFTFDDPTDFYVHYNASGMFQQDILNEIWHMQNDIVNLNASYKNSSGAEMNVTLNDICYQPHAPNNKNCAIHSVLNYFQNNYTLLNKEVKQVFSVASNSTYHIQYCTRDPYLYDYAFNGSCMAAYGGPVDPNLVLGDLEVVNGCGDFIMANASIITFVINDHADEESNKPAIAWENAFVSYLKSYKEYHPNSNLSFSFSSKSSISEELNRKNLEDVYSITIWYSLIFLYIAVFLGIFACKVILTYYGLIPTNENIECNGAGVIISRIGLDLLGVCLAALSVVAALGLLSYMYTTVEAIPVIIELVPILGLAIGTSNLFILINICESVQRRSIHKEAAPVCKQIGDALGEVAPSVLLTFLTEAMAFFLLGGISTIPLIKMFSFLAGIAVVITFLLQMTVFIAVISLDSRRIASSCLNLCCLFDLRRNEKDEGIHESFVFLFMKDWYAPFLLHKLVRAFVVYLFSLLFVGMLVGLFTHGIGSSLLNTLPKDSYLQDYFDDMSKYLHTGPPVYFVIKDGYDYTDESNQNKICASSGCDSNSVGTQISLASLTPEDSKIAEPANIWLDSYFRWIDPRSGCCAVYNGILSNATMKMCKNPSDPNCEPCVSMNTSNYRPNPAEFIHYLPLYRTSNPYTTTCNDGSHGALYNVIVLKENKTIGASYLKTYHTVLKSSKDYTDALKQARKYSENFSSILGHEVFAYSDFYILYEEYLSLEHDVFTSLSILLGGVFVMSFLLMGFNMISALIVTGTVALIIVDTIGMMAWIGISLNVVSIIYLLMTAGISVGFCSHTIQCFANSQACSRVERAKDAIMYMGTLALGEIISLVVLVIVFAASLIFINFNFSMYIIMIGFGPLHGLVFLPVLLSIIGPLSLSFEDGVSVHSSSTKSIVDDSVTNSPILTKLDQPSSSNGL